MRWLSELADACVGAAVDFLLRDAHDSGKLELPDPARPGERFRLDRARHGQARRLRAELFLRHRSRRVLRSAGAGDRRSRRGDGTFARLLRRLVRILQDRTGDGYVFRTDLRLRPDPGSTPLAIPVEAALHYYESRGQNWERAALIKARPVAGDIAAGEAFLRELQPYVWRKYIDYAAIADIHSIKRQIHAHKGHGEIAVKGHNIKLGRGGIREIEFFVQTQQLIAGGRMPELAAASTEPMLAALAAGELDRCENARGADRSLLVPARCRARIQMVADEQTHVLPTTEAELKRIAYMMGFADVASFSAALSRVLQTVERRYAQLFETGGEAFDRDRQPRLHRADVDDPDTLETLSEAGLRAAEDIPRPSAPGITAAIGRRSRSRRASG